MFFYDEQQVWHDLATLRNVLAGGWLLLTVLAGLAGTLLARRTLAPVAQASDAARSLAEGLLDTRLPVTGDDEFATWAASFNEMAEALESKIDALSQAEQRERVFTANVAHELRTPLTALVGEAQLLADQAGELPPESAAAGRAAAAGRRPAAPSRRRPARDLAPGRRLWSTPRRSCRTRRRS